MRAATEFDGVSAIRLAWLVWWSDLPAKPQLFVGVSLVALFRVWGNPFALNARFEDGLFEIGIRVGGGCSRQDCSQRRKLRASQPKLAA